MSIIDQKSEVHLHEVVDITAYSDKYDTSSSSTGTVAVDVSAGVGDLGQFYTSIYYFIIGKAFPVVTFFA
ncbi:hypothetical protein BDC45DRAFT_569632 [Circinella umbellata]|nr:hypothetical protein BDC45DRAFT_569632 [Circinella umbellata]